ncbi:hypothetical protein ABIF64_001746 [Bradyrhizobium japonicum]|uniref:hypothetical protein n=1 Tax=Bradyrhizobium japonicum TaxID=375 RepID=UPI003397DD86
MFAYARGAIDFWTGWKTEQEFLRELQGDHDSSNAVNEYNALKVQAMELAKKVGWEGDVRQGPFIAGLPTHETADDGHFLIAWKQDNNGDTFVVSPYRLPWLEDGDYGEWVEG